MLNKLLRNNGFLLLILISIICLYVYRDFITLSKLYVYLDWGWDTYGNYWAWYAYLIDWAKAGFPMWNFKGGIGSSIFSVSNYIFDPFNLFYIFLSKKILAYMFPFVFIAKIILSALFFYYYLNIMGFQRKTSLIVSLFYAFNGYMILWGQHYQFVNIVLYAPLLLYALEALIQRSRWIMFTIIIALTAIYSYYFFYMISIYLLLYAIARYILINGFNYKKLSSFLLRFGASYTLGVGLSAIILFPSAYSALTSPRVGYNINFSLKPASLVEYISILGRLFSNDTLGTNYQFVGYSNYYESPQLYCGLLTLLLIPQLFKAFGRREKIIYGGLGGILFAAILIPYGSVIFNAFSALTYRWSFVLILFELIMLASAVDFILKDNKFVHQKILRYSLVILCKILLIIFIMRLIFRIINEKLVINSLEILQGLMYSTAKIFIVIMIFLYSYYFITSLYSKNKLSKRLYVGSVIFIACLELAIFSNITVNKRELVSPNYITNRQGYFDYTSEAVSYLQKEDNSFYRLEKSFISATPNEPLFQNYYGTTVYSSLNNPSYVDFVRTIGASTGKADRVVDGFKDRISIQTLLGVKYYLSKEQDDKPFGYSFMAKFGDLFLFRNNMYLPLGYTYNSYITEEEFSKLSVEEKDRTLLKYFILKNENMLPEKYKQLNKYNSQLEKSTTLPASNVSLEYSKLTFGSNMKVIEQGQSVIKFTATDSDPMIFIPLKEKISDSKIKISFEISSLVPTTGQIFYAIAPNDFKEYKSKKFSIHQGTSKYEVDLGLISLDQLRVDIGEIPGEYVLKNIQVTYSPSTEYVSDVENLRKDSLNVDYFSDDYITGQIKVSENKLLALSIPYDKGWRIFVDGIEEKIIPVNAGLSGVYLPKGDHAIKLQYTQPGLLQGVVVTVISLLIFLTFYFRKYLLLKKRK
ncbi:YfhO family protein [Paenibacillus mesophilus]|uniref:YfhO family protein n=1 Tax=Paenibacillus mesophilus TaxID=2582849 RepID=UPI00110F3135|nr:YfhO family protein [Paenibacillus mesophilus]TMV50798.1 YfhO family protein [Paenibacillus mesophilus]